MLLFIPRYFQYGVLGVCIHITLLQVFLKDFAKFLDLKIIILPFGFLQMTSIIKWQSFSKNLAMIASVLNFQ